MKRNTTFNIADTFNTNDKNSMKANDILYSKENIKQIKKSIEQINNGEIVRYTPEQRKALEK
jgi:hypothetical protein